MGPRVISRFRGIFHGSEDYSTGSIDIPRVRKIFHGSEIYSTCPRDIPRVQGIFYGFEGYSTGPRDNPRVRGIFEALGGKKVNFEGILNPLLITRVSGTKTHATAKKVRTKVILHFVQQYYCTLFSR